MKKTLLLSLLLSAAPFAAFAADLAVETPAPVVSSASDYSGFVEGSVLGGQLYDSEYDVYGFGLAGALAYKLDANWQIQIDVSGNTFKETDDDGDAHGYGYGALHANYYVGDYALGAFGGVAFIGEDYFGLGGIEGQASLTDDLVLSGQIGYAASFDGPVKSYWGQYDFWFGELKAQYFLTDNFALSASVGIAKGDNWNDGGIDQITGSLEASYKFDDSPLSVFASYSYIDDRHYDTNYAVAKIGARFSFDGESLKSQAKTGASHKVYDFSGIEYNWW